MSAETELYSSLSGMTGLASLVGSRIYPDAIPENSALPAVVYMRTGTNPTYTIGGVLVCEEAALSITAWADSRSVAESVADQIQSAVSASQNPATGRSSGFDNEVGLFAVTIETTWFTT